MAGSDRPEFLILGAGIAGCALAHHLAGDGHSVVVLDPRPTAGGASGRAAGVVTEQLWNLWDVEVTRASHQEARSLLEAAVPQAYWSNGFLRWSDDPAKASAMRAALGQLRGWGVTVRDVGASEMRALVPGSRLSDTSWGLYSEGDGCVSPSALTEAYAASARARGALLQVGRPVEELRPTPGGWSARSSSVEYRARELVIAAGAWSKRTLQSLGAALPLTPYRTQAALLRPAELPEAAFPSIHDLDTDVYVRPELGGRILVGDGTEQVEADPETFVPGGDASFLADLAGALQGPLPGWAEAEVVASWAGVCTATLDRRPLVGPVPGVTGLHLITGFNGFGIMRAGGVARRLAKLLEHPDDPAARAGLAPVRPDRFHGPVRPFPPGPGFTLEGGDVPRF